MKIAVVGGGPSGMMAALSAKTTHQNATVVLFERNPQLGKKMRLTGGGRCNVTANTNVEGIVSNVVKNGRFLYSSLNQFGPQDIIRFFEDNGVPLKEEDHHRMFPDSNRSSDIVDALEESLLRSGVTLKFNSFVKEVTSNSVITDTDSFDFDHIILATGSRTLPNTGSDGNGYDLAKTFGHSITDLHPQEVPLVSNDLFIQEKTLQGLSFKDVTLKVKSGNKTIATLTHDLIITHFGLSGPVALRASYFVQTLIAKGKGPITVQIDFIPGNNEMPETHPNLHRRFVEYLATRSGSMLDKLKRFEMTVYDTRGFSYAFVTNGGVNIKEIDPKTLRSKLVPSVSLCGELMDVSAYTGGYNITAALSSGYAAGKHVTSQTSEEVEI